MEQLKFEFDLSEGLKDETKAKEVIAKVQKAIDDLVIANSQAQQAAKDALTLSNEYEKQVDLLLQANTDLADALKNIHIMLNAKRDLFKEDKEMVEFMEKLATWTLSSAAIKSGVISKKRVDNEGNK